MALARVYCGLAAADQSAASSSTGTWLTAAVVDDAGRLLDVCELGDDPGGYARLVALLAERAPAAATAAVAADSDEHLVTALLAAAGRPLAYADEDATEDYAERFADDASSEEPSAAERRALGLARALQAGALSAAVLPAPRDLLAVKPMLAAHGALVRGRLAAASVLREVLRELYPAALRAYRDPAEPLALAILDALPEPGRLGGTGGARARDAAASTDALAGRLAEEGVAEDPTAAAEAITALRVAVAETPRRSGPHKSLTSAVADAVREAVAAVRA
ncbi:MAG TPA: transposase, partial [Pilimelia sp.]|nr:transposase [Pilimelia sp.]